jgi:serine/threonine-protein kinase
VPLVLEGKAPATPDELLHMTRIFREYHQRPATVVRLFQAAFKAKPELEKNVAGQHRYHAATAAAQAGCGQGEDAGNLPTAEQARLRALALTWLRAELDVYARPRADGKPAVPNVEQRLARWQADADLAYVREPQKLIQLPTEERTAWNALWADVAALLKKAEVKPK